MISLTEIPEDAFFSAKETIIWIRNHWGKRKLKWEKSRSNELVDDYHDETYFDVLFGSGMFLIGNFADTGNNLARFLMYMEATGTAKVPMVLHPRKHQYVESVKAKIRRDIIRFIEDQVDIKVFDRVKLLFHEHYRVAPIRIPVLS